MTSRTTERFRRCFTALPDPVRRQAREAYKRFIADPGHPGFHFKLIHTQEPIYSVRVGRDYRAVGVRDGDEMTWYWIGSHADYDKLLAQM